MTRDEAIEALRAIETPTRGLPPINAEVFVDGLSALGLLKFDAPAKIDPRNPLLRVPA